MKMICPHCGVKGSADDSLLTTKVKCPKCQGIFTITSEIVEPIPVGEFELEQIDDAPQADLGSDDIAGEVDEAFLDIFGDDFEDQFGQEKTESAESADEEEDEEESELLKLLNQEFEDDDEEGLVAALSGVDDDDQFGDDFDAAFSDMDDAESGDDFDTAFSDMEDDDESEDDFGAALSDIDDDDEPEEELTAALSDLDDEEAGEELTAAFSDMDDDEASLEEWAHSPDALTDAGGDDFTKEDDYDETEPDDDNTLTVIEDIPVDDGELGEDEQLAGEISLEETDALAMSDDDWKIGEDTDEEFDLSEELAEDDTEYLDSAKDEEEFDQDETEDDELIDGASAAAALAGSEKKLYTDENIIQKCAACGKYVNPIAKHERGDNVYCSKCVPAEDDDIIDPKEEIEDAPVAAAAPITGRFSVGTLIKDSWRYCKGVKGSIWAALIVMYFILFAIGAAGIFLVPQFMATEGSMAPMLVDGGIQVFAGFLSYIFSAGLILIAVRRVGQQPYSWKMVFSGFKKLGTLILTIILQTILLIIGFCLFIIPGIYLTIGYMLVFPLVMDKGLSPWQAMEASRKAIHTRWWTVFFAFILMAIIASLSAIPAGIGLIWTVPMFFIMIGILYYHFFGGDE